MFYGSRQAGKCFFDVKLNTPFQRTSFQRIFGIYENRKFDPLFIFKSLLTERLIMYIINI